MKVKCLPDHVHIWWLKEDVVHTVYTVETKALERSPAVGDFYETGIDIGTEFGLIGSTTEKRAWADYEQLFRVFILSRGRPRWG